MAIINPEWVTKEVGSFQTAEEMNTLAAAVKNNAVELQTDVNNLSSHISNKVNPHEVTKVQLDLDNVDNVSDINKPVSIAQAEAIAVVQTNLNNHKADVNNPHGVTKVQIGLSEVNNTSDINKPVSAAQASAIDIVQSDIDIHKLEVNNPHSVTKAQVGLGNVDDTSDVNKPISIAQHTAIDAVQDDLNIHKNNTNNPHNVTKTQLGLSAVDNTADVNKPISIATQTALNLKVDKVRQIIAGNGLTGGGDLSTDRTLSVVSANDGITINTDNVQLNTIDNVTTTSITKPLSANQGKVLNDNLVQLGADLKQKSILYATSIVSLKSNEFTLRGYYNLSGLWVSSTEVYSTPLIRVYEGQKFNLLTFTTYGPMLSIAAFNSDIVIDLVKSNPATTPLTEYVIPAGITYISFTTRVLASVSIVVSNNIIELKDEIVTLKNNVDADLLTLSNRILETDIKDSNRIDKPVEQSEFNVNGYYNTSGVWKSTGRYSTSRYKVYKGQRITYQGMYNYGDVFMIAFLDNEYNCITSKSILANISNINGYVDVDDDSIRYVVFSIRTDTPVNYHPRFGFSVTFANSCNLVKNSIPISRILSLADFLNSGKIVKGILESDNAYVNTDYLAVKQGQAVLISKLTSVASAPMAVYDDGKNYLFDAIVAETTTGSYFYIVPENVHYIKLCAKTNSNLLVEIYDFQKFYQEKSSNLLFKNFERFTSNESWTISNGIATSPLQLGNWSFLSEPVGTGEDEFTINCRLKVLEADVNGHFELGIGKYDSAALYAAIGSYTNTYRWFTLCKNSEGSFLKTYNATNGTSPVFTEIIAERQVVSEELILGNEYIINFTKITNPESVLDCKLYNSGGNQIASTVSTNNFWQCWGTPCAAVITGKGSFSHFSFNYPKKVNPKLGWYMDSYGEGASLALRADRYVGKIKADLGYKDCVVMGWGGEKGSTGIHRMLLQQQLVAPRYAVIALGFNDPDFTTWFKYMSYMLNCIIYTGSIPVFVTCCPCGPAYGTESKRTAFFAKIAAINDWIKASGYIYIDANAAVTVDGINWKDGYLQDDQAHPTVLGHLAIYNRIKLDCPYLLE